MSKGIKVVLRNCKRIRQSLNPSRIETDAESKRANSLGTPEVTKLLILIISSCQSSVNHQGAVYEKPAIALVL